MTHGIATKALGLGDIIFNTSAAPDVNRLGKDFKRANLSTSNRLRSIQDDISFVNALADAYKLPLVANERCGSWYVPTERKAASAYFKSTDGHAGEWSFSLRRLNLQVLEVIGKNDGCIIVDSTRRGKSMPDALSKTVPVWMAVMNRFLFPDHDAAHQLRMPEAVVSASEHAQIEARLPGFLEDLRSLKLDVKYLRSKITRPMRPLWITQDDGVPIFPLDESIKRGYHPVVLCTASRRVERHEGGDDWYVQGAADDSESWASGLDVDTFHRSRGRLCRTGDEDLAEVISSLLAASKELCEPSTPILIRPTCWLWIGSNAAAQKMYQDFDLFILCGVGSNNVPADKMGRSFIHLACTAGKTGSRQLRSELPKLTALNSALLNLTPTSRILVSDTSGADLAVGVALAICCLFASETGQLERQPTQAALSKVLIKQRLSWITITMPNAAPSRATLQSVNAFLLS